MTTQAFVLYYEHMDQTNKNQKAIEEVEMDHGRPIRESYELDAPGTMNYLRLLGLKCASCGDGITGPNFQFYGFNKNVQCYNCQNKKY